jgi:hypothetical protein
MSIKNKFATAVATASLLAGLFGSAFVPSALAARETALDTPSVAKTELYTDETDIATVYGSNPDDGQDGFDRAFWVSLTGLEVDNEYNGETVITAIATAPDDDFVITYELNTKNNVDVEEADLKATSSSSLIKLAWSYDDDGGSDNCEDLNDTNGVGGGADRTSFTTTDTVTEVADGVGAYDLCIYSNGKPGTATIAVVANGVTLAPVTVTVVGDIASVTLAAKGGYIAEENEDVEDFFTVTAKDSAGTVINGPEAGIAGGVILEGVTFGDVAAAEANPVNQQGDEIDFIDTDAGENGANLASGLNNDSWTKYDLMPGTCVEETASGENDGDAGKSYAVAISINNEDDDDITSNTVSFTCTGPEGDAKLSKFEVEATSGDLEYTDDVDDVISIYAYFTDQAGRPLGAGAELDLDVMGLDSSANASFSGDLDINLYTDNNNTTLGGDVVTDGTTKTEIGELSPNMDYVAKFPYTISVESSDLQSATDVAKSLATFYTATNADAEVYTLTRVRNAAKTRATITVNFGAECSNQMVDFDVELANGDVKFLERRANIDGRAVLTIERRNTKIYVKAFCNDGAQESDLRGIRFR